MFTKSACLFLFALLFVCGTLAAGEAPAEDSLWMTDFEAAKAKAKAEKKLLFLDFTGSDWCGWCIALHKEVLDLPTFKTQAPLKFILVELDYPQQKEQTPALKAQNKKLAEEYKVEGFPTIYITDSEGKPIAKTGYAAGGPEKYMASLNGVVTAHETVVSVRGKLGASTGLNRAKLLDELLTAEEKLGMESEESAKFGAEIIALDVDNKTGFKTKYLIKNMIAESQGLAQAGNFDEAIAVCEKVIALPGVSEEQKQIAYFFEGQCWVGKNNFIKAVACLIKSREADPKSENVAGISKMITRFSELAEAQAALDKLKTDVASKKGAERAQGLDQVIEAYTQFATKVHGPATNAEINMWSKEIITLDAGNKLGLKTKYEFRELIAEAKQSARAKDAEKVKAALDKALALPGITPEQKNQAEKLTAATKISD
jgi:thioredoxin-related protein